MSKGGKEIGEHLMGIEAEIVDYMAHLKEHRIAVACFDKDILSLSKVPFTHVRLHEYFLLYPVDVDMPTTDKRKFVGLKMKKLDEELTYHRRHGPHV